MRSAMRHAGGAARLMRACADVVACFTNTAQPVYAVYSPRRHAVAQYAGSAAAPYAQRHAAFAARLPPCVYGGYESTEMYADKKCATTPPGA